MEKLDYDIKLAATIQTYRELKRIKQSVMADALKILQASYCKIEKAEILISPGQLKIISSILNTSILQILVIVVADEILDFQFTPLSDVLLKFVQTIDENSSKTSLTIQELEFIFSKIKARHALLILNNK
jgi:transcriptional regulator with XRE-family HTH domain